MNGLLGIIIVNIVDVLTKTMVFWAPIILFAIAAKVWLHFRTEKFVAEMELFLTNGLYYVNNPGWYDQWVNGETPIWFSLELVSIGGSIHFLIRCPSFTKDLVESQLYAQFPQVEVSEIEDYVYSVPPLTKDSNWRGFGTEFTLEKPDPLPIKTYIDFGLDKNPDEEEKIDPMTSTIELMGNIKEGEQLWLQIGVRPTQKKYHSHGVKFGRHGWQDEVDEYIKGRLAPYTWNAPEPNAGKQEVKTPKALEEEILAVRRKSAKLAFDCVIRLVYAAKKGSYNENTQRILRTMFNQYGAPSLNRFKRVNMTIIDYWWQNVGGTLVYMKEKILQYYRERVYFHPPLRRSFNYPWPLGLFYPVNIPSVFVLNTEELASIYHFPGRVSETPTFKRVESKTSTAPWNLPK